MRRFLTSGTKSPATRQDAGSTPDLQYTPKTAYSDTPFPTIRRLLSVAAAALLVAAATTLPLFAQSNRRLTGTVVDDDGGPVPQAEVALMGSSYRTTTDAAGRFAFDDIPTGRYLLNLSSIGYYPFEPVEIEIVPDVTRQIRLVLRRRLYPVSDVTVKDTRPAPESGVVVVGRAQIDSLHPESTADLLESIEGVHVERTGPSGHAQVRIRGGAPHQVLVLLDGQRLNSAGDGTADLNSIPLAMVDHIKLHKGGASAQFGPDALGGVVNIVTQPSTLTEPTSLGVETSRGQWNTRRYQAAAVRPIGSAFIGRFAYTGYSTDGDFDFAYQVSPGDTVFTGPRINNRSSSKSYFTGGQWRPGRTRIGYSFQLYEAGNGLPGRASQQNEEGYRDDDRLLSSLRIERRLAPGLWGRLNAGYSRYRQFFKDRTGPTSSQYESGFTDDRRDVQFSTEWQASDYHSLELGGQYRRDRLDHEDYLRDLNGSGRTVRRTWSAFVSSRHPVDLSATGLLDDVTLTTALRYDNAVTRPEDTVPRYPWEQPRRSARTESWSPRVGVSLTRGERLRFLARASWGRSLRLPSINALFWQGDARSEGNPDLKPERSEDLDASLELNGRSGPFALSAGATFYHNEVKDLVVWTQTGPQGVFKPVNLGAARITGHEDFISVTAFDGFIALRYGNSVTHARNQQPGHNSYDKWLTYTPAYVTTMAVRLEKYGITAGYNVRLVGRRYALAGNERWYDAYALHDLTLRARIGINSSWRVQLDGCVRNLTNEQYVLIAQHPMPGREYGATLKITFTAKDTRP